MTHDVFQSPLEGLHPPSESKRLVEASFRSTSTSKMSSMEIGRGRGMGVLACLKVPAASGVLGMLCLVLKVKYPFYLRCFVFYPPKTLVSTALAQLALRNTSVTILCPVLPPKVKVGYFASECSRRLPVFGASQSNSSAFVQLHDVTHRK
jgi:hypothetical protein